MLAGDLFEGAAALAAAGAVYLLLAAFAPVATCLGASLLVVAAFVAYAANVHGGVTIMRTERAESS